MKLDNSTAEPMGGTEEWFELPPMIQGRSDHACSVAQFDWEYGIIVAGNKIDIIINSIEYRVGPKEHPNTY